MPAHCAICGDEGTADQPIAKLERIDHAARGPDGELRLCRNCIDRRTTKTWARTGDEGKQIAAEWLRHNHPEHDGRLTYLVENDETIHLMRLREDWVEGRVADASKPS